MDMSCLKLPLQFLADAHRAVIALHRWYEATARDVPWRRTRDPYAVWISEVMLQQTQVATVVPYYEAWLHKFPDVAGLAGAGEAEVLKAWEGLGYYSRARNLHRAARAVMDDHGGQVPADEAAFGALPGVGPYTLAAVLSISFGRDLAVVDGNVRRVLGRLVALERDPRKAPWSRALDALASELLPPGTARTHNQAVMELGALICTPRSPGCAGCPLGEPCLARGGGDPEAFPPRPRRKVVPHHQVAIGLVFDEQGRVFIDQRPYDGMLGGLWEFPGGKLEPGESVEQALARELMEELGMRAEVTGALPPVEHAYSHFKVTLHPRRCAFVSMNSRAAEGTPWRWVRVEELAEVAMPRANRKVLEHLKDEGYS